jgi:lantibiotic modifying enzyme
LAKGNRLPKDFNTYLEVLIGESARELLINCDQEFADLAIADLVKYAEYLLKPTLDYLEVKHVGEIDNPIGRISSLANRNEGRALISPSHFYKIFHCNSNISSFLKTFAIGNVQGYLELYQAISDSKIANVKHITGIKTVGDFHEYGRAVRMLTFGKSPKDEYVFKPRSAKIEIALHELLKHDFSNTFCKLIPLPIWSDDEFSIWNVIHDLKKPHCLDSKFPMFANSYGYSIALSTLFGIEDLHHENILLDSALNSVVLVDLETVGASLIPANLDAMNGFEIGSWIALRSGLIPSPKFYDTLICEDSPLCAFFVKPDQYTSNTPTNLRDHGFFDRSFLAKNQAHSAHTFLTGILDGIRQISCVIAAQSDIFWRNVENIRLSNHRFIYRPTRTYISCIRHAIFRLAIFDEKMEETFQSILFEQSHKDAVKSHIHSRIVNDEISFLQRGQVPRIFRDPKSRCIFISTTTFEDTRIQSDRQFYFSDKLKFSFKSDQIANIVKVCITSFYEIIFHNNEEYLIDKTSRELSDNEIKFNKQAKNIVDRSVLLRNGQRMFFDIAPLGLDDHLSLQWTGMGLYRGAAGIGLALQRLGDRGNAIAESSWESCFSQFITALRDFNLLNYGNRVGFSFGDGIFGIAVALSTIERHVTLLKDGLGQLESAALNASKKDEMAWDYISGLAGIALSLACISARVGNDPNWLTLKVVISEAVRKFLAEGSAKGREGGDAPVGIAHGLSGLLYAIRRCSEICGRNFEDVDMKKLDSLEQELLSERIRVGWTNSGTWCGGAVGVIASWDRHSVASTISYDEMKCLAERSTGGINQFCCGDLGRAAVLGSDYGIMRDEGAIVSFDRYPGPLQCLGLFQGVSGYILNAPQEFDLGLLKIAMLDIEK